MLVHVFARHSRSCDHKSDPQWKRCRCVRWVTYPHEGKQYRESTKKRSHEGAALYAREVEKKFERIALGEKPKPNTPTTIEQSVAAYIADKRAQQLQPSTLSKRVLCALVFLTDLDLPRLREWRSSCELGALAMQKKGWCHLLPEAL